MDNNKKENTLNSKYTRNSILIILISNMLLLFAYIAFKNSKTIEEGFGNIIIFSLYLCCMYFPLNIVAIVLGLKGYSIYKKIDKEFISKRRKILQIISMILLIIMIIIVCGLILRYIIFLIWSVFLRAKAIWNLF